MRKLLFLISIVLVSFTAQVKAQSDNIPNIVINSNAAREVVPDKIYLSIKIDKENLRKNMTLEDAQNAMIKILKKMNIDVEKRLKVGNINSSSDLGFFKNKKNQITDYVLELSDTEQINEFIEKASDLNIKNIRVSKVDYSKKEELLDELRVEAVKAAKKRAILLTSPLDQKVGKAISIQDHTYNHSTNRIMYDEVVVTGLYAKNGAVGAAPEAVKIDFRKIRFEANVNIKFALE